MKLTPEILYEKIHSIKKAIKLQATEYERRLEGLNHENDRIKEVQKDSIPREVFDRTINNIMDRMEVLTVWKTKQEGRNQLIQWVPWLIAAIAIIANWFKK